MQLIKTEKGISMSFNNGYTITLIQGENGPEALIFNNEGEGVLVKDKYVIDIIDENHLVYLINLAQDLC